MWAQNAMLDIGSGSSGCPDYRLSIFSIDGDIDNAYTKYKYGGTISLSPAKHEIAYACESRIKGDSGTCLYSASLAPKNYIHTFGSNKYQASCTNTGELRIEAKS